MTRPLLFPVEAHSGGSYLPTPRTVAMFFDSSSAIDFICSEHPLRCLFLGEPRYDRRESGYRPAEKPSGYREWCAAIDARKAETVGDPLLRRHAA
jgi:hypothetical protein